VISAWTNRKTRKFAGTGLLISMIDDQIAAFERTKAARIAKAAANADEERAAVSGLLTENEHARSSAVRGFVASGGEQHEADTMSEQFIEWAVYMARSNGTLSQIVQAHRLEQATRTT
jgi:hypothetical protein